MKNEINIIEIINLLIKRIWLLIIMALIGAVIAYMYTDFFVIPRYETEGKLYVNCETEASEVEDSASAGKLNSNYRLAQTYVELLRGRTFLDGVSADVNKKYSGDQIKAMLTISPINETELLQIKVEGTNADDITDILNSILERSRDELIRIVKAGSVEIVDYAELPKSPISPNVTQNTVIGAILGLLISAAAVIALGIFDTHIKTPEQIKNVYDEPLLGEIPSLEDAE